MMKCNRTLIDTFRCEISYSDLIHLLRSQGYNVSSNGIIRLREGRDGISLRKGEVLSIELENKTEKVLDAVLPG